VDKRKKEIIRFNPEAPIQGGFSQDGRYAVWANKEGDFCWLDLGLPDLEVISQLNDNLMGAGISASGDRAFGIREQSLSIRRIGEQYDGKSIKKNIQSGVRLLESNFDGTRLAIVMGDDTTWILNGYGDFLLRLSGYGGKVEDLAFGPDGKNLLMVASGRGYIWKGEANLAAGLFRGKRDLKNVIFRKEGLSAWFTYGPEIRAFDPRKGVVQKIISDAPSLDSLAISPDGSWLAAGTEDSSVIAWSVDGNEKFRIKGVDRKALISQLQDKAYAISQGGGLPGGALRTLVKSIKTHTDRILSIAISPDGKKVLTGSGDASVRLWNVSGKSLAVVHGLRFDDEIERLMEAESGGMFSQFAQTAAMPDFLSNIPVSRELSSVRLEDVEGHTDEVRCVAFAPDGKRFLSASADGRIGLWTLKGGKESLFRVSDAPLFSACFSPDGAHILAGDGKGELSFWDLKGNEVWRDRNAHTSAIRKVCYSPDGSKMLSASQDRTVMIRTAGGTPILRLERYLDWVFDADFSPDGKYVCTVDADRALRFWLIDPEDALLMGDQAELHTLTEEEKGRYGINLNI
jgi:WD40 repeat protein